MFNGFAVTSLLTQVRNIFENVKEELKTELEDQDYDDIGTASIEDVFKSIKLVGIIPESLDEDVREFLRFMALRNSRGLNQIDYNAFMKIFEDDYNLIENPSMWAAD